MTNFIGVGPDAEDPNATKVCMTAVVMAAEGKMDVSTVKELKGQEAATVAPRSGKLRPK